MLKRLPITQLVEEGGAQGIVVLRVNLGVLIAVNFDHQALPSAAKIREVKSIGCCAEI